MKKLGSSLLIAALVLGISGARVCRRQDPRHDRRSRLDRRQGQDDHREGREGREPHRSADGRGRLRGEAASRPATRSWSPARTTRTALTRASRRSRRLPKASESGDGAGESYPRAVVLRTWRKPSERMSPSWGPVPRARPQPHISVSSASRTSSSSTSTPSPGTRPAPAASRPTASRSCASSRSGTTSVPTPIRSGRPDRHAGRARSLGPERP